MTYQEIVEAHRKALAEENRLLSEYQAAFAKWSNQREERLRLETMMGAYPRAKREQEEWEARSHD